MRYAAETSLIRGTFGGATIHKKNTAGRTKDAMFHSRNVFGYEAKTTKPTAAKLFTAKAIKAANQADFLLNLNATNPRGTRKKKESALILNNAAQIAALIRAGTIAMGDLSGCASLSGKWGTPLTLVRDKGQKRDHAGAFDRHGQGPLVLRASAGDTPRQDLPPFGDEPAQDIRVFVVYLELLIAKFADLFLEKDLALAVAAIISIAAVVSPIPIAG
jgi:hypothetical protein